MWPTKLAVIPSHQYAGRLFSSWLSSCPLRFWVISRLSNFLDLTNLCKLSHWRTVQHTFKNTTIVPAMEYANGTAASAVVLWTEHWDFSKAGGKPGIPSFDISAITFATEKKQAMAPKPNPQTNEKVCLESWANKAISGIINLFDVPSLIRPLKFKK